MSHSSANPGESRSPTLASAGHRLGLLYAILAVCFFSITAVLVRWAAPLSSFQISFGRLFVGSVVILGLGRLRGESWRFERSDWLRFAGFGVIMAVHIASYVTSLTQTTIAHAITIVYTAPIFIALLSARFLKESLPARRILGLGITIIGLAIMVGFEPNMTRRMLTGDLLALVSAVTYALYSLFGRSQRDRFPLFTYAGLVYGLAALWLLPFAASAPLTLVTPTNVLAVVGLGLISTAAGHTLYNAALRHTHAAIPNVIATQEVPGGVLLGYLFLHEVPGPATLAGLGTALAGIILVLW